MCSVFISKHGTTREVAKDVFDDLIMPHYKGLTVLIKDSGSYPTALPLSLRSRSAIYSEAADTKIDVLFK